MDGWNEDKLYDVTEVCDRIAELNYEIKNCVRGAYSDATTYKALAEYIRGLAEELENQADTVACFEEDITEYDLEEV
jgi:NADPH-dependent glutamate synthase beta subunit-like oxidoreductase